jgi:hypothetical protein
MRPRAKERIRQWKAITKRSKNVKLRLTGETHDLLLATSLSIDGRVLRVAVYDFLKERSKEGVLVEFSSNDGKPLNIIQFFEDSFKSAWDAALPLGFFAKAQWYVKRFWQFLVTGLFALLAYLAYIVLGKDGYVVTSDNVVSVLTAIFSSVAASFLVAGLVEIGPKFKVRRGTKKVS